MLGINYACSTKKMMKMKNKEIRRKRRIKYDFEKSLEKKYNKNI
jgi:hypothetical protein